MSLQVELELLEQGVTFSLAVEQFPTRLAEHPPTSLAGEGALNIGHVYL